MVFPHLAHINAILSSNSLPQKPMVSSEGPGVQHFGKHHRQAHPTHRLGRSFPPAEKSRPHSVNGRPGSPAGAAAEASQIPPLAPSPCVFGAMESGAKIYLVYHIKGGISTNNTEKRCAKAAVWDRRFWGEQRWFKPAAFPGHLCYVGLNCDRPCGRRRWRVRGF